MNMFATDQAKTELARARATDPALAAAYERIIERIRTQPGSGVLLVPPQEKREHAPAIQALIELFTRPPKKFDGKPVYATTEPVESPAPAGVASRTHAVGVYVPDWAPAEFRDRADRTLLDLDWRDWSRLHWRTPEVPSEIELKHSAEHVR
jgi:hypothetical protein